MSEWWESDMSSPSSDYVVKAIIDHTKNVLANHYNGVERIDPTLRTTLDVLVALSRRLEKAEGNYKAALECLMDGCEYVRVFYWDNQWYARAARGVSTLDAHSHPKRKNVIEWAVQYAKANDIEPRFIFIGEEQP